MNYHPTNNLISIIINGNQINMNQMNMNQMNMNQMNMNQILQNIYDESFQGQKPSNKPISKIFLNELNTINISQNEIDEELACAICQDPFKLN